MRCLRHEVTTLTRRYLSPRCFEPRARAYSSMRSSLHPVGTAPCATIRPIDVATGLLRFHRTAGAQGLLVGHDGGSGGKQERRRIGEYSLFHLHVCVVLPCRLVQRRARATMSFYNSVLRVHVPPSLSQAVCTLGLEDMNLKQRRPYVLLPLARLQTCSQTELRLL